MWFWLPVAWGSTSIDRTIEASAEVVKVSVVCGEVKVVGADRKGVRVTGHAENPSALELAASGGPVSVVSDPHSGTCAQVTVEMPARSALEVETRSALVRVEGVTGEVELETISGDLTVRGGPSALEAQTVSGWIRVTGGKRIEVATVSGAIEVREATGEVSAASVSGSLTIGGAGLGSVELQSVNGSIELSASLSPDARVEVGTHSGRILARLPAATDARLEVESFSGRLTSAFGAGEEQTLGSGRGRIELSSFSGEVVVERTGGDAP